MTKQALKKQSTCDNMKETKYQEMHVAYTDVVTLVQVDTETSLTRK